MYKFAAKSSLGEALLGQKMLSDAEPLLEECYMSLVATEKLLILFEKSLYKRHSVEGFTRLIDIYEAIGQKEKADVWRKRLDETKNRWKMAQS